ncbi:BTAD domain-containing putative transcriptional regulator [Streptomyces sp. NPDC059009]|uniref:AfsR/SARP family transcriptional regulator n=1 Tax=Streptomyces sp. NPDC059009 TaxID=3346694 RepID=UPI0036A5085F
MRYRVLGTTQALRPDGSSVPVGGARLRALLTVLALRAGRPVPASVLVDEVWGDEPPADATGALQALVGRLRRAVGADAVASAEGGGYRLCADRDDVDVFRFERLTGEGGRALADGDPAKAADALDAALELWAGPALADLPDRTADAARWEALRLDARRLRLTAALALGDAEQALPELTALCDTHPLDEPLQALRLRALRDAGRPAEALAAYEEVRRLLADRLGTDPGPELRALQRELLNPAPSPAPSPTPTRAPAPAPAAPAPPPPVAPEPAAPAPAPTPRRGNLRARLTSFVGRESDIDVIRGDLGRARLVTLLGPGGAGKTRLSQEAAETLGDAAPDGVWLAELAPVDPAADPDAVPEAVLTALGARESLLRGAGADELRAVAERGGDDPLVRLTEYCVPRRMVLILDNCEHVVDTAARLAERLLERCPGLTILATSREPLGVPGELLRPVEPLPTPVALRLFAERGAAARPGFSVTADPEAAAEICRRLDGLPLAIELAAARLRMLTPRQIADRLDNRFRLLTSGARTVLPRQQTLRAVVDWSWDLLDEPERAVLRRLSVFSGGCDLAAAEAVCGGAYGGKAPDVLDVADVLGSLVDKSLVVAAPSASADGEMRYRLLETVGEYAAGRLGDAAERRLAERAHLAYFHELARTTDPELRGRGQLAAIERLQTEYENLRTALRHAVAAGAEQEGLCLVLSLAWFWQVRDLRTEARHWSKLVKDLGPDPFAAPLVPAAPLYERCTDRPLPWSGELLQEARRGVHLVQLATIDMELDQWETEEGEAKLRRIRDAYQPGMPQTCWAPGNLWFYAVMLTGEAADVRGLIDATVAACREHGYTWELAMSLQMRANILANRSDWAGDALGDAEEALRIVRELGDVFGEAETIAVRGEARERIGEYALAARDFEEAIARAEVVGAQSQISLLQARRAEVLIESGEGAQGEEILRDVLDGGRRPANEAWPAARLYLAKWLGITGRTAEAREQLDMLADEFKVMRFPLFEGFLLSAYACLDLTEERWEEGLDKARRTLDLVADPVSMVIAPHMRALTLLIAAWALSALDGGRRAEDAARLVGAAHRHAPPGHVQNSMERVIHAEADRFARAALGDARYESAYAEGGDLSLEEAAALV